MSWDRFTTLLEGLSADSVTLNVKATKKSVRGTAKSREQAALRMLGLPPTDPSSN